MKFYFDISDQLSQKKIFKKINDLKLPMKFQRSHLRVYKNVTLYRSFKKSMLK